MKNMEAQPLKKKGERMTTKGTELVLPLIILIN
jgi:hypothetical protein